MSTSNFSSTKQPTFYISHGGGPCFFMKDTGGGVFAEMDENSDVRKWYESFSKYVPERPKAILVISAHWEESPITVITNPNPKLLYDYYGFPDYTYQLEYKVPHSAQVVSRIKELLNGVEEVAEDKNRGLDHGVFIPLKLIYPQADIPVVQLSLHNSLNPERHFKIGQALAPLRDEGVLILASGSATHNLQSVFSGENSSWVKEWIGWFSDSLTNPSYSLEQRKEQLFGFKKHRLSKKAHPREEHFIPFFVAWGAANSSAEQIYDKTVGTLSLASFKMM